MGGNERTVDSGAEVFMQATDGCGADDIDWPHDGIGCDRYAASQGLQNDQAECVGAAGEDEDVGGAVGAGQVLAEFCAEEVDVRVRLFQFLPVRAVANNQLGARPVQREEVRQAFFNRQPPGIKHDRPGQEGRPVRLWTRVEQACVNAARPLRKIAEAAGFQIAQHSRRWRQHAGCGPVKPADQRIGPAKRHAGPGVDVFGKAGVERSGEGQTALHHIAPGEEA